MERVAWTDDRIDDAMTRIDRGFDDMKQEMREMRTEMRSEFRAVRADLGAGQRQMTMIGWTIAGVLMAQLITFVVVQS